MEGNKNNILKHLKKSDPGFIVPKDYFEGMEDRVDPTRNALGLNPNQNQKSPFNIDDIGKDPGFSVPEGYFDTVEAKINRADKTKVIRLKSNFTRLLSLSIAASILLFFGINYLNKKQITSDTLVFQDEEFVNWIESDLVDFNSYEIAEAFNDMEIEHTLYAEDEVGDYLNGVDIENLILENK